MTLQDRLVELSQYGVNFSIANGTFVITIKYDKGWDIIQPDEEGVECYRDDNNTDIYYYTAPISVNIDKLFESIYTTINYNKDIEKKLELFKAKMKELQEVFAAEDLETLKGLEFKFKKKRGKPKKKDTKEKSVENETNNTEETDETTEESEKTEMNDEEIEKPSDIDSKISEALKS